MHIWAIYTNECMQLSSPQASRLISVQTENNPTVRESRHEKRFGATVRDDIRSSWYFMPQCWSRISLTSRFDKPESRDVIDDVPSYNLHGSESLILLCSISDRSTAKKLISIQPWKRVCHDEDQFSFLECSLLSWYHEFCVEEMVGRMYIWKQWRAERREHAFQRPCRNFKKAATDKK